MAPMLLIQKEKSSLCWQFDIFIGSEGVIGHWRLPESR
jgi:hypothetical protein